MEESASARLLSGGLFDALSKSKNGNTITPKALYLALAVRADGPREVLGMWLSDNEGAAYWTSVFNEIKSSRLQ